MTRPHVSELEAWIADADVFELAGLGLAIKRRVRAIGAKLDELEGGKPAIALETLPASAEALDLVLDFVRSADVASLEQLALEIKARVAGVAGELADATVQ